MRWCDGDICRRGGWQDTCECLAASCLVCLLPLSLSLQVHHRPGLGSRPAAKQSRPARPRHALMRGGGEEGEVCSRRERERQREDIEGC